MKYAKAVFVFDKNGNPLPNAIAILNEVQSPLTNSDGYGLFPATFEGNAWLIVIADGYKSYLKVFSFGNSDQNIFVGKVSPNANDINLPALSFSKPFQVMNPIWKGNDCGIHLDYLPKIDGGSSDQTLFVGWMYDRYPTDIRARIRVDYAKQFTHIALSWIDAFDNGESPESFLLKCQEWDDVNVEVGVFLTAKESGFDHNVPALVEFATRFLNVAVGIIPAFVLAWEESLFLDTDEIWEACRLLSPIILKQQGTLFYLHEQEGYMGFPKPDQDQASFWWPLQGLVHGILLQRRLNTTDEDFAFWIQDCLARLNGGFNMPKSNGIDGRKLFGTGFELNYMDQFFNGATTDSGNRLGHIAILNGTYGSCNGELV